MHSPNQSEQKIRQAVLVVAVANLAYFFVEFYIARTIDSVSLFADSIDFLEDTTINLLILVAFSWSLKMRSYVGMCLAGILLIPAIFMLWTAWQKFNIPIAPVAGLVTLQWHSGWPDLIVGIGIAILNADAAKSVWEAARQERLSAEA